MAESVIKKKITYKDYNFSVAFDSGEPNTYVGIKDVDITKNGYTPISISIYSMANSSSIIIMSLQIDINGRNQGFYLRENLVKSDRKSRD
jgi:hypothetical protein